MMMEKQLEEGKQELEECERVKEKVDEKLREMGSFGQERNTFSVTKNEGDTKTTDVNADDARRLWKAINDMDGD